MTAISSFNSKTTSEIRQLVSVGLGSTELPDSVIMSPVFLKGAEFQVYRSLDIANEDDYLTKVGLTSDIETRFPINYQYRGTYANGASYREDNVVNIGTTLYYANKDITSAPATLNTDDWFVIDVVFKEAYNAGTTYMKDDIVSSSLKLYLSLQDGTGNALPTGDDVSNSFWKEVRGGQSPAQKQTEEQIRLAIEYQAAILLILSLPQIIEEQILRERVRYQEIDWQQRVETYERLIESILGDMITTSIFGTATAIFGEVKQYLAL